MAENKDLYNTRPNIITMYSTSWCPDCKRSRTFLSESNVKFQEIDIGKDNEAFLFIEKLTRRVKIPTIVFPDGTILVEPTNEELKRNLEANSN
jgi:glutaredoxin